MHSISPTAFFLGISPNRDILKIVSESYDPSRHSTRDRARIAKLLNPLRRRSLRPPTFPTTPTTPLTSPNTGTTPPATRSPGSTTSYRDSAEQRHKNNGPIPYLRLVGSEPEPEAPTQSGAQAPPQPTTEQPQSPTPARPDSLVQPIRPVRPRPGSPRPGPFRQLTDPSSPRSQSELQRQRARQRGANASGTIGENAGGNVGGNVGGVGGGIQSAGDPRWVLAVRTCEQLEGTMISPDKRERLIKLGRMLGLTVFDANLVIAVIQDQARRGHRSLRCAHAGEAQLSMIAPPRTTPQTRRRMRIAMITCAVLTVEMIILWSLFFR